MIDFLNLFNVASIFGGFGLGASSPFISSAVSRKEAEKNRRFQAKQAQIQRDWLTEMSNTAHQREVDDLYAAGLNPILSATGGNGASTVSSGVPSGSLAAPMSDPASSAGAFLSAISKALNDARTVNSQLQLNEAQASKLNADASNARSLSTWRLLDKSHEINMKEREYAHQKTIQAKQFLQESQENLARYDYQNRLQSARLTHESLENQKKLNFEEKRLQQQQRQFNQLLLKGYVGEALDLIPKFNKKITEK